jgi:hypothetical protein
MSSVRKTSTVRASSQYSKSKFSKKNQYSKNKFSAKIQYSKDLRQYHVPPPTPADSAPLGTNGLLCM